MFGVDPFGSFTFASGAGRTQTGSTIDRTCTPAPTVTGIKVVLKSIDRTIDGVGSFLARISGLFINASAAVTMSLVKAISTRFNRTVTPLINRNTVIEKKVRGKAGRRGGDGSIPTFVAAATYIDAATSSVTVTWPGGLQADDIAILSGGGQNVTTFPYISPPDGTWNLIALFPGAGTDTSHGAWWKRLDGTESGSLVLNFTTSTNLGVGVGALQIWRGCERDLDPVEGASARRQSGSSTPATAAIETLGVNRKVVSLFHAITDAVTSTPGGGAAEHWDISTIEANDGSYTGISQDAATMGSHSGTVTLSGSPILVTICFALVPTDGGGVGSGGGIDETVGVAGLFKQTGKPLVSLADAAGSLLRSTAKLIDRLVDAPAVAAKQLAWTIAALIDASADSDQTFIAGGGEVYEQDVDATSTPTYSISKTTAKAIIRTGDVVATMLRSTTAAISAPISAALSIALTAGKVCVAATTTANSLARSTGKPIDKSIVVEGRRALQTAVAATVSATGSAALSITRNFVAAISHPVEITYALLKQALKPLAATADGNGEVVRNSAKIIHALATAVATRTVSMLLVVSRAIAAVATAIESRRKTISHAIDVEALQGTTKAHVATAAVEVVMTITRTIGHIIRALISVALSTLRTRPNYVPPERTTFVESQIRMVDVDPLGRVVEPAPSDRSIEVTAETPDRIVNVPSRDQDVDVPPRDEDIEP